MSDKNLKLNKLTSRLFILSPAVESGIDRESTTNYFYQYTKNILYLGCLGIGKKVKHLQTDIPYTIVLFGKDKISKLHLEEKINSSLSLMYKSTHFYLFRLLNHYETEKSLGLIFEPFEGDSLDNLILKKKCDIQTTLKYFVEVLIAVNHMNSLGLYNLNIRPENILVDEYIKLTDYGLKMAGKYDLPKRPKDMISIGNRNIIIDAYFSPEEINSILNTKGNIKLDSKLDSWKCGILLFEMLTNFKSPFTIDNTDTDYISFDNELTNAILKSEIDLSIIQDNFCRDLIGKLLKKNPKERMDITSIFDIKLIQNINIEQRDFDLSDNIINIDNDKDSLSGDESGDDEEKDKELMIKKLVSENEILKKELSKSSSKNINLIGVMRPLLKGDKKDENIKNNYDFNKENNSSFSEEDMLEQKSNSNDNIDIYIDNKENIYEKYKKLKEKYLTLNKEYKNLEKQYKSLSEEKSNLEKEKEQNTLNFLNNFEKINTSKITNISELSDIVINSINIFKESQKHLETLIEKLIKISDNEHTSLINESKKYLDDKSKIIFDTFEKLKAKQDKQEANEKNKEERKNVDLNEENEIVELNKKNEADSQKENILKEKNEANIEEINAQNKGKGKDDVKKKK